MSFSKKSFLPVLILAAVLSFALSAQFAAGAAETEYDVLAAEEYQQEVAAESPADESAAEQYPVIQSFENRADGLFVKWSAYPGAARYRVYVRGGNSWRNLGEVTSPEFLVANAKDDVEEVYTVRALDANRKFISRYYTPAGRILTLRLRRSARWSTGTMLSS